MDSVNGDGWRYNYYWDKSTYNKAGIKTDWTYNPFVNDKFYFRNQQIDDMTAAQIVFLRGIMKASVIFQYRMLRNMQRKILYRLGKK